MGGITFYANELARHVKWLYPADATPCPLYHLPKGRILTTPKYDTHHYSNNNFDDLWICKGVVKMIIPIGGNHVRQVNIRLPEKIKNPVVTASLSTGVPGKFVVNGIDFSDQTGYKNCKISATDPLGHGMDEDVFCHYIVIGEE